MDFCLPSTCREEDLDVHFKVYHELMSNKVFEILLVASPYDAYILEEDGSLASKISNEYRGLNLSRPPRITQAGTAALAIKMLEEKSFHLVLAMPYLDDMDVYDLGRRIKRIQPNLPVILLAHSVKGVYPPPEGKDLSCIDQVFIWSGDSELLLAIVKSVEDRLNVAADTQKAMVRVLLLVEDSPLYTSYFLPLIYKEVVNQTQEVLEESLNHEHRLLKMRARPKILVARNYEQAHALFRMYGEYLFGVISDTRYPKNGHIIADAGYIFLSEVHRSIPDLPLLLISNESHNRELARRVPADFLDKNSNHLFEEIRHYFLSKLGFGNFVFRRSDGSEIARASNLKALEDILPLVPDEALLYHATRNRFSNWIMARSEIALATLLRKARAADFSGAEEIRQFLIAHIHGLREWRQRGVVIQFKSKDYDPDISNFVKIGEGSMGGKARGLAFVTNLLRRSSRFQNRYPGIHIQVPQTLVITTQGFDAFIRHNGFDVSNMTGLSDDQIAELFMKGAMPFWLEEQLCCYLESIQKPLSIRSSGLLEDVHNHPSTGLYKTFMVPNNHPEFTVRCNQLITAVKLVYASTWFKGPKRFLNGTAYRIRKDQMAVIVQQLVGEHHNNFFYPDISGIAQSHNYYPVAPATAEDGVVSMVLGFGRGIPEGEPSLRFSPAHPKVLPQFSKTPDILSNAQRQFWALGMKDNPDELYFKRGINVEKRYLDDAESEVPVQRLSSTYVPDEDRIRDTVHIPGRRVLTFASVLKYETFPLAGLLKDVLDMARDGMGCAVELEFSILLSEDPQKRSTFNILQMRPMASGEESADVTVTEEDAQNAICYTSQVLGHGRLQTICDIVFVRPETFNPKDTVAIARSISARNRTLRSETRPYLLLGPGRWGSFDRWLGIPVKWRDIDGVGAIVEIRNDILKAEPSYGSHFFQHITSQGIPYLTVTEGDGDKIRWDTLLPLPKAFSDNYICHLQLDHPLLLKCDGRNEKAAVLLS
jgi:hypothetical protein